MSSRSTIPDFAASGPSADSCTATGTGCFAGLDPIDLNRLAQKHGSANLLDIAARGGPRGRRAVLALPYADDRELALRPLCDWLVRRDAAVQPLVATVLAEVLRRPGAPVGPIDMSARTHCSKRLARAIELAQKTRVLDELKSANDLLYR